MLVNAKYSGAIGFIVNVKMEESLKDTFASLEDLRPLLKSARESLEVLFGSLKDLRPPLEKV